MNKEILNFIRKVPSSLVNDKLVMLAIEEGVKATPYKCTSGKITIGIGRNLEDSPLSVKEIYYLFDSSVDECVSNLEFYAFYKKCSDVRKLALLNMMFNLGASRFNKFQKMIAALNNDDYDLAAEEIRDSIYWRSEFTHDRAERIARMIQTNKRSEYYEL